MAVELPYLSKAPGRQGTTRTYKLSEELFMDKHTIMTESNAVAYNGTQIIIRLRIPLEDGYQAACCVC